jgi:hypothetical protein
MGADTDRCRGRKVDTQEAECQMETRSTDLGVCAGSYNSSTRNMSFLQKALDSLLLSSAGCSLGIAYCYRH